MRCGDIMLYGNRVGVVTKDNGVYALALSDGTTEPYNEEGTQLIVGALDVIKQFKEEICKQVR